MITVSPHPTELFTLHLSVDGFPVYLDFFAIKELAKGDATRRQRFVAAVRRGAEVLFSVANAAELTGPLEGSFEKMREFLDELGPRWFPVELDPRRCVDRELEGRPLPECVASKDLLRTFTAERIRRLGIRTEDLPNAMPPDFFRLGSFMDWLAPQRQRIMEQKGEIDRKLIQRIKECRAKYAADHPGRGAALAGRPFSAERPATFVYANLIRNMVVDRGDHLKKGDGIDFCQAVVGPAYASVATLDKLWKRRVEALPKPNGLAKIYCSPNLDQMVEEIERNLDLRALQQGRALFPL